MKKLITVLLATTIVLAIASCGIFGDSVIKEMNSQIQGKWYSSDWYESESLGSSGTRHEFEFNSNKKGVETYYFWFFDGTDNLFDYNFRWEIVSEDDLISGDSLYTLILKFDLEDLEPVDLDDNGELVERYIIMSLTQNSMVLYNIKSGETTSFTRSAAPIPTNAPNSTLPDDPLPPTP
ncbi:MAG: lipocalin family protein [Oscillospiraceae bacterium]|jgi:hypothetical protein|nr:lipocalin family protein [Oscillospiraceae bacterium]